jgi:hypothetical protein
VLVQSVFDANKTPHSATPGNPIVTNIVSFTPTAGNRLRYRAFVNYFVDAVSLTTFTIKNGLTTIVNAAESHQTVPVGDDGSVMLEWETTGAAGGLQNATLEMASSAGTATTTESYLTVEELTP